MSDSSNDDDNYVNHQSEKIKAEKPHEETDILEEEEEKNLDENVESPEKDDKEEKNDNQLPELKAEWTVHAQLRISRPGETISKEFSTNDPTGQQHQQQPANVIYKWSTTDDGKTEKDNQDDNFKKSGGRGGIQRNQSKKSTASKESLSGKGHYGSFHSTAEDSGNFSNASRKNFPYGTRCRSTCNIILSAVADFLPDSNREIPEETDPFVFNTTTSYTVSPDQPGEYQQTTGTASQNFALGKILALRDATSQTSDTETKYFEPTPFPFKTLQQIEQQQQQSKHGGRKRTPYEYRRLTDSSLPSPTQKQQQVTSFADEGHSLPPSYTSSPARTYKSPSLTKIPNQQQQQQRFAQSPAGANYPVGSDSSPKLDQKKPPRTVHIDVYCTGSEEEENEEDDDADVNSTTSTTSDENRNDIESNSTPQTVLDTEQMYLRHQRVIGKTDLPRRFVNQQQLLQQQQHQLGQTMTPSISSSQQQNIPEISLGHAITKSTTAEEISESKQILFKKHIGDQRLNKINSNRNRNVRKDPSDDAISSNYPNSSSRSTMRDLTCSSLSSYAVPPSHDIETSSWKETEPTSFNKSDSFEYDNSVDRMRIKSMERQWSVDPAEMQRHLYTTDISSPQYYLYQQPHQQQQQQHYQQPQHHFQQPQQQYQQPQQKHYQQPQSHQQHYQQSQQQHYQQPQQHYQQPQQHYQYQQEPAPQMHPQQQARIQHFLQSYQPQPNIEYPWRHQSQQQTSAQYSGYSESPEFDKELYTFSNKTIPERDEPSPSPLPNIAPQSGNVIYSPHYQQLPYGAGRGYRYGSEDRPIPFDQLERRRGKVMFTADYNKSGSEASTLQSNLSGYTNEYLTKARRFGSVVTAMKKPGHHIGPAKNPECQCEHCRRWMTERSEGRGRAYSLGDTPRGVFWLSRND